MRRNYVVKSRCEQIEYHLMVNGKRGVQQQIQYYTILYHILQYQIPNTNTSVRILDTDSYSVELRGSGLLSLHNPVARAARALAGSQFEPRAQRYTVLARQRATGQIADCRLIVELDILYLAWFLLALLVYNKSEKGEATRELSNLLSARSLLSHREHRRCCARRAMRAW